MGGLVFQPIFLFIILVAPSYHNYLIHILVSLGISPRMLQLPRAPQLNLSTWGSYILRGDSVVSMVAFIVLIQPSIITLDQVY